MEKKSKVAENENTFGRYRYLKMYKVKVNVLNYIQPLYTCKVRLTLMIGYIEFISLMILLYFYA